MRWIYCSSLTFKILEALFSFTNKYCNELQEFTNKKMNKD